MTEPAPTMEDDLCRLALAAGRTIMEVYGRDDLETATKGDQSPVTEADIAADAIISAGLHELYPDIPAVTEEEAGSHNERGHARFFLVDPLDGTKEFIQRRGEFTVNIALIEDGRPTRAVVLAPALGLLYRTEPQGGATACRVDAEEMAIHATAEPIQVREPDNDALVVVASKSHRDQATDDYIARYSVADFRSAGSSLKLCLIAAGEADFYPRLGRTMEWDTAAG
ncbi:MAG TPA: 3'(2'),5'-bisphosphate nucleotidase CysQ, partial [Thermohalobaculum sp.]|nr:3'(2'),5'-bisphosphate nucleotidase CysQ [Thermohalobaculum sp.]